MAYFTKEDKAVVAAKLKEFMPAGWKYSLSVKDDSIVKMTISEAPLNLEDITTEEYLDVNTRHASKQFANDQHKDLIVKIIEALNTDNYNESDSQSDYFDVGHGVELSFGTYKKPFKTV